MPLEHYLSVIEDLSRDLPAEARYRRLLHAIRQTIPCDAIGLLRLVNDSLQPVAFLGLREEVRGRRFTIEHHPRLKSILYSEQLVRFPADSDLPDPYDGLLLATSEHVHIHDCMGMSIYIDDKPWGVITLDAVQADQFESVDPQRQTLAISLTRAVVTAAERIHQLQQQLNRGHAATAQLNKELALSEITGTSAGMQKILADVDMVAPTPLAVLIAGETGVGKELIARRLHLNSDRFNQPLVKLNCAALPENLAEAELFGHTRGAFSGANGERAGRFELADGGTLFLDEVGELPLNLQAKLLRAIQEGEVQRIGSDHPVQVNVRIIAATNRDLEAEVEQGRFRADLFHRLSVFPITVPPLRDRQRDVLHLAEYFLERDQQRLKIQKLVLSAAARTALMQHSWPGNVRELEHVLSRAALRASRKSSPGAIVVIDAIDLSLDDSTATTNSELSNNAAIAAVQVQDSLARQMQQFQRNLITQALVETGGNIAAAARSLAVDRSNLLRLMKRLGIRS
ncbi:nitric oxide reductase transcriptional regulator NorR [Teredinibacter turnerae]|uniref:nitric oxide reductase transcriptional regulator NorR n=1 Tax=Teredinibacter turnerae TaxID=2426 RepID=UPI0003610D08|nr:nitric oxide reductase transcriptional regulator NorR [Teredinibacter turnerae]